MSYQEYIEHSKNPSFMVYVITGNYFWKREFVKSLEVKLGVKHVQVTRDIKHNLDKLRFKSLLAPTQLIFFEAINSIQSKDLQSIKDYFRNISKNGYLVISLKDYKEKRQFIKEFKNIKRSSEIKLLEMDYPSRQFIINYIRKVGFEIGLEFDNENTVKSLATRIGDEYSLIRDTVLSLKEYSDKVTIDDIKELVPDNSAYSMKALFNVMCTLDRKKLPIEAIEDLISDGISPTVILKKAEEFFEYVYQAKILKTRGILLHNDIIPDRKKIADSINSEVSEFGIWKLSEYRINEFIKISDYVSEKEILLIRVLIEKSFLTTKTSRFTNKELMYTAFLSILNRRDTSVSCHIMSVL